MEDILEYMKAPQSQRQSHMLLSDSCSEIGGNSSVEFKGLLAYYLGTTIPSKGQGYKIHLCHACGNHKCSNVRHLYWGTPSENKRDAINHGTAIPIRQATLRKYSAEQIKEMDSKRGKLAGEANRKPEEYWQSFAKFFEGKDLSKRGWAGKIAKEMGVSHTEARRRAKRLKLI